MIRSVRRAGGLSEVELGLHTYLAAAHKGSRVGAERNQRALPTARLL